MMVEDVAERPAAAELVRRAREMIPYIAERAAGHDDDSSIDPEVVRRMKAHGFYRILQPTRWGGYELGPDVLAEVQMAIAEADMSTAWVFGVMACHNFQAALFDDKAARDVWGEDETAIISSAFPVQGDVHAVSGGYKFDGQWAFSSGCEHADWIFVAGLLDGEFLTCLVPKRDYRIVKNWDVVGLRGTGSNEVVLKNVFVPEYRVHKSSDGFKCDSPGNTVNKSPLYRIPFHQVFIRAISNVSLGGLQGMLTAVQAYARGTSGVAVGKRAKDPDVQLACGEAQSAIDEMKVVLHHNFKNLVAHAEQGVWPPPFDERLLYKYQSAVVPERCLALANRLFKATGSLGLSSRYPFGRFYRDMIAVRQHVASQGQITARNLGAKGLGLEIDEWYL